MANVDDLQKEHEAALNAAISARAGRGQTSDWALVRAMIHKAVHVAAERNAAEYCSVATLLADMISHAHRLMHPSEAPTRGADVH